jgi:hypothetical protein
MIKEETRVTWDKNIHKAYKILMTSFRIPMSIFSGEHGTIVVKAASGKVGGSRPDTATEFCQFTQPFRYQKQKNNISEE